MRHNYKLPSYDLTRLGPLLDEVEACEIAEQSITEAGHPRSIVDGVPLRWIFGVDSLQTEMAILLSDRSVDEFEENFQELELVGRFNRADIAPNPSRCIFHECFLRLQKEIEALIIDNLKSGRVLGFMVYGATLSFRNPTSWVDLPQDQESRTNGYRFLFSRGLGNATAHRRSRAVGRPPGSGSLVAADQALIEEMHQLLTSHEVTSVSAAAEMVADRAVGGGTRASRSARLRKRYQTYFG